MKSVLVIDARRHERLNPDREYIELAVRPHEPQPPEELRIEVNVPSDTHYMSSANKRYSFRSMIAYRSSRTTVIGTLAII